MTCKDKASYGSSPPFNIVAETKIIRSLSPTFFWNCRVFFAKIAYIYIYVYIYICRALLLIHKCMYIYICICVYIHKVVYTYIYMYVCIFIYIYIYTCVWHTFGEQRVVRGHRHRSCIYIYVYVHMHIRCIYHQKENIADTSFVCNG